MPIESRSPSYRNRNWQLSSFPNRRQYFLKPFPVVGIQPLKAVLRNSSDCLDGQAGVPLQSGQQLRPMCLRLVLAVRTLPRCLQFRTLRQIVLDEVTTHSNPRCELRPGADPRTRCTAHALCPPLAAPWFFAIDDCLVKRKRKALLAKAQWSHSLIMNCDLATVWLQFGYKQKSPLLRALMIN